MITARRRYAHARGYKNFAEFSFAEKGEKSPVKINEFIQTSAAAINARAAKNLKLITKFAKARFNISTLKPWDIDYIIKEMALSCFNHNAPKYKDYFEAEHTITGILDFFSRLFAIKFTKNRYNGDYEDIEKVLRYSVADQKTGRLLGTIELCLFNKYNRRDNSGARRHGYFSDMDGIAAENLTESRLTFNFFRHRNSRRQFFGFQDIATIFHEMGHALEALFRGYYHGGTNEGEEHDLDACEFSSQFTENFAYEFEIIAALSRHWKTGKSLPRKLFQAAANFEQFRNFRYYEYQLKKAAFDLNINRTECKDIDNFTRIMDESGAPEVLFNPFIDRQVFFGLRGLLLHK